MNSSTEELTAKYQWTIANRLSTSCPAASRFYLSNLEKSLSEDPKLLKKDVKGSVLYCNHCGNLWLPGNHHIRVSAPPAKNNHIKKLLKYEAEQPWKLNNRQKKKLKKFKESTSKIVYTCNICKKVTTFPGIGKRGRNETSLPFNTPVPKIRSKKGDLNAGLFIKIPSEKRTLEEKIPEQPSSKQLPATETQESNRIESSKSTVKVMNKRPVTTSRLSTSNTIVKSSNKKRKTDLLSQILNQEQESKKKKNNLSSFLISL